MINIRNLGSKGSVRVKYKGEICTESCLKLWFESAGTQLAGGEIGGRGLGGEVFPVLFSK